MSKATLARYEHCRAILCKNSTTSVDGAPFSDFDGGLTSPVISTFDPTNGEKMLSMPSRR
jgi:hypothetical protein